MELEHKDITEKIIGAAFEVFKVLGHGFLERVYQRAMLVELRLRGLSAEIEAKINVRAKYRELGQARNASRSPAAACQDAQDQANREDGTGRRHYQAEVRHHRRGGVTRAMRRPRHPAGLSAGRAQLRSICPPRSE